mmetsp:Transcript_27545/g.91634  ORF Transcript_27545/g.91634 Transcript_27545/m.91634 type:complete len:341 (-) Transcript_27545:68-1090(-)
MSRVGRRTAILGGSGSGKSTLFALALRFYVPSSGRVLLDGADVARMGEADLRRRTAWVQQEPPLFPNITIRDNIAYGLADCSMDAVEEAAREANAFDFIAALPSGFETRIGAAGASLSGGQKQRIALARALVRDPALLLLDEATSALDNENEAKVQTALDNLARRGSALVIAHRLSTIRDSDAIVVVDHGRVVECGTHAELIAKDPDVAESEPASPTMPCDHEVCGARAPSPLVELPPVPPTRQTSAPSKLREDDAPSAEVASTTYRRLWDAATGSPAKMSLQAIAEKVAAAEEELARLKKRQVLMQQQKQRLIEPRAELCDRTNDSTRTARATSRRCGS